MTGGGGEWGSKKRGSVGGICFLGQALHQRMNTIEFVLGRSAEMEVSEWGFWCVAVVHAWLVPSFHSSDDG